MIDDAGNCLHYKLLIRYTLKFSLQAFGQNLKVPDLLAQDKIRLRFKENTDVVFHHKLL
jgi:hypothetical protein